MHSLDHLAFEPLGPAAGRGDQAPGRLDLRLARTEQAVGGLDLARVDERLAVEAEALPLRALGGEAFGIVETVMDSVEGGDPGGAGGEEDGLEGRREGRAVAAGAKPEVGGEVVGAGDQALASPRRWRRRSGPRAAVSIIARTGLPVGRAASRGSSGPGVTGTTT